MAANVPAPPAVADPDANALLDNAYLPDPNPVFNAALGPAHEETWQHL
jgi:hypothetical protein